VSNVHTGDRRLDRGACDDTGTQSTDQRHVFQSFGSSAGAEVSNNVLRLLASGWQFSPILKGQVRAILTVNLGTDNLSTARAAVNQRPILCPVSAPIWTTRAWMAGLNPKAFAVSASGHPRQRASKLRSGSGNVPIGYGRLPTFRIAEGKSIQVRGEAFNLPNHLNPGFPSRQ